MNCCKFSQCLKTYGYIVLIHVIVSIFPGCISKVTVNWTIATTRIVLGSDLKLECRVKGEDRNESSALKRWTGGSYDHAICIDTKCIKEDKYEIQNDQSQPSFNLTIKNVDEKDIMETVTCWYNFESSSGTVISQKDTIVFDQARITKQASDYMIDGNYLDVYITLDKVFPEVQNCSGTVKYDKFTTTLDKGLSIMSSKLPSGLYRAVVNGTLELPQFTTNCARVLKLTCNFAFVPITLFDINSTQCELQKSKEANGVFVILFAGFLVLFVLKALAYVIFRKYFYTKRKRSMKKRVYTSVQKEEIFEEEIQDFNETNVKKTHENKRFSKKPRRNRRDKRRSLTLP